MPGRYGHWGKHIELFELWEAFNDDPALRQSLAESEGGLLEGTGAPEGRADFPLFLQTVIRVRMRERFNAVAAKWRSYMGIESAQDFREQRVNEMGGIVGMRPVPEYGEYKRLRSREVPGPAFAVAKHGGIYSVTFELVVNDQTDYILNRTPRELGRMAGEYKSQVFVAFVESNPTYIDGTAFFHASRGNVVTGAGADPTEDNLVTILETMTLRRDVNNIPFTVTPRRVLVRSPRTALRIQQILRSQQTIETTAGAVGAQVFARGSDNPLAYNGGILPPDSVVQEPWFNDANDWYILGDAADRPAFIAAFLRGRQEPFIGLKDPGVRNAMGAGSDPYSWEFDQIDYKVRDIFGTGMGEPLAAMKMIPS